MPQKLPTFKEYINEELKDKEFRKFYEKERTFCLILRRLFLKKK